MLNFRRITFRTLYFIFVGIGDHYVKLFTTILTEEIKNRHYITPKLILLGLWFGIILTIQVFLNVLPLFFILGLFDG